MFYQNMVYIGFFFVWVLYFVVFTIYMGNLVKEGRLKGTTRRNSTFVFRMYGVALTNVFIAVTVVIMPIVAMVAGVHPYWIAMGVIYTLTIHYFYMKMLMWGEIMVKRVKVPDGSKMHELKENRNLRTLFNLMVVVTSIYLLIIVFNAFGVLPIQSVVFPPIMPLYYHMILDFLTLLGLFLLSAVMVYVVKKRLESIS